jgi:deoxyribose-phosphate aldolase
LQTVSEQSVLARRAISLIDLTALGEDCGIATVEELCEKARTYRTAAVCVWPDFVIQADAALGGSGVGIATVVNFPSGDERPYNVGVLTDHAVVDGATEIDVVLPYRAFLAGNFAGAAQVLEVVRRVTSRAGALMKVILETGELGDPTHIAQAASFAIDHGADFIKTSTGKTPISATPAAVEVMLTEILLADREVGIKPSGGIATLADAATYIAVAEQVMGADWVTPSRMRLGASRLLDELVDTLSDTPIGPR